MCCLVNKYRSWPCPSWQILDEATLGFIGPFFTRDSRMLRAS